MDWEGLEDVFDDLVMWLVVLKMWFMLVVCVVGFVDFIRK